MQNVVLRDGGGGTDTGGGITGIALIHEGAKPLQGGTWENVGAAELNIRVSLAHGGDRGGARGHVSNAGTRARLGRRGRRRGVGAGIRGKTDPIVANIVVREEKPRVRALSSPNELVAGGDGVSELVWLGK